MFSRKPQAAFIFQRLDILFIFLYFEFTPQQVRSQEIKTTKSLVTWGLSQPEHHKDSQLSVYQLQSPESLMVTQKEGKEDSFTRSGKELLLDCCKISSISSTNYKAKCIYGSHYVNIFLCKCFSVLGIYLLQFF